MAASSTNPLLNPGQPLAGKPLQQAATALTDAQVKGPLAEYARQLAQQNRQGAAAQKLTGQQFGSLGQYVKQASGQETGIANDLNAQLKGIGDQTQTSLAGIGLQGAQSMLQHAPQGENPNMASPAVQSLAAELARERGTATQDAGTFRSFGATQGANYRGLAAQNMGTYALKGQEALKGIAQATRLANEPINAKIADLNASRGSLLASNEGKLRQQEISNGITRQGLGLKQQALSVTAQNNAANQSLKLAAINATLRGQDIQKRGQDLSHQDRLLSNQLRALGMSFGGIATVLNRVIKARQAGNTAADKQALAAAQAGQGVQGIVGIVNKSPGSISIRHIL